VGTTRQISYPPAKTELLPLCQRSEIDKLKVLSRITQPNCKELDRTRRFHSFGHTRRFDLVIASPFITLCPNPTVQFGDVLRKDLCNATHERMNPAAEPGGGGEGCWGVPAPLLAGSPLSLCALSSYLPCK